MVLVERSAEFKAEIKEVFREGIEKEERGEEKQKLIKRRDEILDALEKRLKNICFWTEIANVPPGRPILAR
ncbi:MAG TPA: hypothetical protein VF691_04815 [Cytophagaceae bacterium]